MNRIGPRTLAAFKYLVEHGEPPRVKQAMLPRVAAACYLAGGTRFILRCLHSGRRPIRGPLVAQTPVEGSTRPCEMSPAEPAKAPANDGRSERIVETDRSKFLGMDPTLAMIVGAVLFVVIVMAMVAMSRKSSDTRVETRRTM